MSAYGEAYKVEIARTLELYERLFAELTDDPPDLDRAGTEALERTAAFSPGLADEIAEIARGAGIPIERIAALNARTEILASCRATTPGECSALVALRGAGGPVAVQTWDWHEELARSWHVRTIEHADGRIVQTMTEHGIVGKIGVSSAGVGTLFTILKHAKDGGPVGVPVHVVARRILDEAQGVDDALAIAEEASVSASTSITVVSTAGPEPEAVSVELYPGGPTRIDPDPQGVLVHTNHFLAPEPASQDLEPELGPDSLARLAHLRGELDRHPAPDLDAALELLACHAEDGATCCHPLPEAPFGERYATLATVALDVACGTMTAFEGGPCSIGLASAPMTR